MSESGNPVPRPQDPVPPGTPDPVPPGPEASVPSDGPVLPASPRWVPAAVVAGAVLVVEGLIVSRIKPESAVGTHSVVADSGGVAFFLGALSLLGGYFAFLLSKVSFPRALEALALTAATVFSYLGGCWVLLLALNGDASSIVGIREAGWTGRTAAIGAVGAVVLCVAVFAASLRWWTGIVWPHFRSAVAINVLAMLHLVVVLLGVVSFLNARFVPKWEWATVDLTATGQYSLSGMTRATLGKVEGELLVFSVDYGAARRTRSGIFPRVQELLRQYQAACPAMSFRAMDALRGEDELRKAFLEAGMESLIAGLTGEEDVVVIGFRPPGEKQVVRTRVVPVNQEFVDTSALGTERFAGEGILTNAVSEVVFAQRKAVFLEGHGEKASGAAGAPAQSVAVLADALRGDNFAVARLNLSAERAIPSDVDLVCIPGPASPFSGAEAEALSAYLARGGAVLLLLDPLTAGEGSTGLEGLLSSWGLSAPRDTVIVSWLVESTLRGDQATPTFEVYASRDEFGRHPAMGALRSSTFVVSFRAALPVFHAEPAPAGVDIEDLVYAPRDIRDYRPFGAKIRPGRFQKGAIQPEPGDATDRRMPVGVTAERKSGEGGKAGGRLVVFGDSDFATDLKLDPRSPAVVPGNRTLLMNAVSWAVRRDLVAIAPKSVESEMVQLRPIDKDLAFWSMVVALPVLALGVAVGMWWVRRR